MFKAIQKLMYVLAVFLMVIPLVSCSGGGSSGTVGSSGGGGGGTTGTLGLGLTDAPGDYLNVFVTIDEVQVKQSSDDEEPGWTTVLTPGQTFDLLVLQNGVIADLGLAELEAGKYNQMRLILGELPETSDHPYANYLVIEGAEGEESIEEELTVPSGYQTGIKIVHGFTIEAGGSIELILDFDAHKSVVQAGNSGQWLLKPTIKVLETATNSVSGVVDEGVDALLEGVMVSAQTYDSGAAAKDEVTGVAGTTTDVDGVYKIYLPPNTYNIVATMDSYAPECQVVDATGYQDYTDKNFILTAADTGTFTGTVDGLIAVDGSALFSIRQAYTGCGMIEVASVSVADGATSEFITLPVGTYDLVVSSDGEDTHVEVIDIVADSNTDVLFPLVVP